MTLEENINLLVDSFNRDVAFEAQRLKLENRRLSDELSEALLRIASLETELEQLINGEDF